MENSNDSQTKKKEPWEIIPQEDWNKFHQMKYKEKLVFWERNKLLPYSGIYNEPTDEEFSKGAKNKVLAEIIPKTKEEKILYYEFLKPSILKSYPLLYDLNSLLIKLDNELEQTPRNLKQEKVKKELEEVNKRIETLKQRANEPVFILKNLGYCSISEGREDFYFNKLLEGVFTDREMRPFIEGQVLAQYKNELIDEYKGLDTGTELIEDSTKKMPGGFTHAQKFYLLIKLGVESLPDWKNKGQGSKHKILAKLLGTSEEVAEGVINGTRKLDLKESKKEQVDTFFNSLH